MTTLSLALAMLKTIFDFILGPPPPGGPGECRGRGPYGHADLGAGPGKRKHCYIGGAINKDQETDSAV